MTEANINVRHRVGWFGQRMIDIAHLSSMYGLRFPPFWLLCYVINHDSYVSVNHGPWQRMVFDITPAEILGLK